jgi:hypothetical protein
MENKELKELESVMVSIGRWTNIIVWFYTIGQFIVEIGGAIIGTAWASMLVIYIFTGNTLYLKLFFGVIALGLIFYFQIMWIEALRKYKQKKFINSLDMSNLDKPNANDINLKFFTEDEPVKYLVTDKKDKAYKKIMFLYPIYGRLNNNGTVTFLKKSQIEPINKI